jgi:hypothetical protein
MLFVYCTVPIASTCPYIHTYHCTSRNPWRLLLILLTLVWHSGYHHLLLAHNVRLYRLFHASYPGGASSGGGGCTLEELAAGPAPEDVYAAVQPRSIG